MAFKKLWLNAIRLLLVELFEVEKVLENWVHRIRSCNFVWNIRLHSNLVLPYLLEVISIVIIIEFLVPFVKKLEQLIFHKFILRRIFLQQNHLS